jgi:hypothetical protein
MLGYPLYPKDSSASTSVAPAPPRTPCSSACGTGRSSGSGRRAGARGRRCGMGTGDGVAESGRAGHRSRLARLPDPHRHPTTPRTRCWSSADRHGRAVAAGGARASMTSGRRSRSDRRRGDHGSPSQHSFWLMSGIRPVHPLARSAVASFRVAPRCGAAWSSCGLTPSISIPPPVRRSRQPWRWCWPRRSWAAPRRRPLAGRRHR